MHRLGDRKSAAGCGRVSSPTYISIPNPKKKICTKKTGGPGFVGGEGRHPLFCNINGLVRPWPRNGFRGGPLRGTPSNRRGGGACRPVAGTMEPHRCWVLTLEENRTGHVYGIESVQWNLALRPLEIFLRGVKKAEANSDILRVMQFQGCNPTKQYIRNSLGSLQPCKTSAASETLYISPRASDRKLAVNFQRTAKKTMNMLCMLCISKNM